MCENVEALAELEKWTGNMTAHEGKAGRQSTALCTPTEPASEVLIATTLRVTLVQALGMASPRSTLANDPGPPMWRQLLLLQVHVFASLATDAKPWARDSDELDLD